MPKSKNLFEIISLAKAWREVYKTFLDDDNSKGALLKLHHLEQHHVRPFMTRHGFYGRGNEEGFEQAHNEFDADMKIVSRTPCPVNRESMPSSAARTQLAILNLFPC